MNRYFYQLWLPQLMCLLVALWFHGTNPTTWISFAVFWFCFGYIGHGIGFHRLLSHRQFNTWRWLEVTLTLFGTLIGYGPPLFWIASHAAHHKYTDTDRDPTAPSRGFWHSVVTWSLKKGCEKEVVLRSYPVTVFMRDRTLTEINKGFFVLNWAFFLIVAYINPAVATGWLIACWYERFRIGFFVNWMLHTPIPGSYQRYVDKGGSSQNCCWLYPFTMGFSLHNNHHGDPKDLREATWCEVDIEAHLIKLISHDTVPGQKQS